MSLPKNGDSDDLIMQSMGTLQMSTPFQHTMEMINKNAGIKLTEYFQTYLKRYEAYEKNPGATKWYEIAIRVNEMECALKLFDRIHFHLRREKGIHPSRLDYRVYDDSVLVWISSEPVISDTSPYEIYSKNCKSIEEQIKVCFGKFIEEYKKFEFNPGHTHWHSIKIDTEDYEQSLILFDLIYCELRYNKGWFPEKLYRRVYWKSVVIYFKM